jgi:cysteinyl-tRNA synthetase
MLKVHNSLTNKIEEFQPLEQNKVRMFVCGPTVYDLIHAGNARSAVVFDVIGRYLEYKGFELNYVQNITDIDDKIIHRAHEENKNPTELAEHYKDEFLKDVRDLKITSVNNYASASEHISEIQNQIKILIEKGYAYSASAIRAQGADAIDPDNNKDVYFDLEKYKQDFPGQYGQLSGQTEADLETGVRVEMEQNKKHPHDFVLWKAKNYEYDMSWQSPWGWGRPGWHIEDTAISEKYLGQQYDLHGGGQDLKFPHHEAEISQQQAASGKVPFVKYWLHNGFLVNKSEKMAKSLGNFLTARELLKNHSSEAVRFYFISSHYRAPLAFEDSLVNQSSAAVDRIADFLAKLEKVSGKDNKEVESILNQSATKFELALDDDFNTPAALAALFELIRKINSLIAKNQISKIQAESLKTFLAKVEKILGIIPVPEEQNIPESILDLVEQRETMRKEKNWAEADKIRTQIESGGYQIDDTAFGPIVSQK